jgi:hypothetical protein
MGHNVTLASFEAFVQEVLESKSGAVPSGSLLGIPNEKCQVIEFKEVALFRLFTF